MTIYEVGVVPKERVVFHEIAQVVQALRYKFEGVVNSFLRMAKTKTKTKEEKGRARVSSSYYQKIKERILNLDGDRRADVSQHFSKGKGAQRLV